MSCQQSGTAGHWRDGGNNFWGTLTTTACRVCGRVDYPHICFDSTTLCSSTHAGGEGVIAQGPFVCQYLMCGLSFDDYDEWRVHEHRTNADSPNSQEHPKRGNPYAGIKDAHWCEQEHAEGAYCDCQCNSCFSIDPLVPTQEQP